MEDSKDRRDSQSAAAVKRAPAWRGELVRAEDGLNGARGHHGAVVLAIAPAAGGNLRVRVAGEQHGEGREEEERDNDDG
jgi:hypothetical protein